MTKELPPSSPEILDVKTLSPQTKMRMVLEIFDLGKDREKNEERKKKFMDLISAYAKLAVRKDKNTKKYIYGTETEREKIHNQIMEIIIKMSLSTRLSRQQRELTEYLASDRMLVETMIMSYYSGFDTSNPRNYSELQMARRGEGQFTSPPGKEDD